MAVGYRGGLITGKIGGDVGYMVKNAKGRTSQGWRAYQAHVSNPNNYSQRYNRVILSTMAKAYSILRPICDHSFEGVSGASRNQKEFAKYNIRMLQELAPTGNGNFNPRTVFTPLANPYLISKGSLPTFNVNSLGSGQYIEVKFPQGLGTDSPTYKDLFNVMGWTDGGQITVLMCCGDPASEFLVFKYVRFVFKLGSSLDNTTGIANLDTQLTISTGGSGTPAEYLNCTIESENVDGFEVNTLYEGDYAIGIKFLTPSSYLGSEPLSAAAVINSTLVGNTWKRSTQSLLLVDDGGDDNYSLNKAIASYAETKDSSLYLNHG